MSDYERPRTNDICDLRSHARRSVGPTVIEPPSPAPHDTVATDAKGTPPMTNHEAVAECCEYCGESTLIWRKCKQLCATCGNINRSCADL